jgi:hypothetical protein
MSLTKEQVECLEEHLPYEVLMLRYTFGKLATPDPMIWNAMSESFAVHARSLYHFLTNRTDHLDRDHIAKHFADYTAQDPNEKIWDTLKRIQWQILHLGRQRTIVDREKFKTGSAEEVLRWIEPRILEFKKALPDSVRRHLNPDKADLTTNSSAVIAWMASGKNPVNSTLPS